MQKKKQNTCQVFSPFEGNLDNASKLIKFSDLVFEKKFIQEKNKPRSENKHNQKIGLLAALFKVWISTSNGYPIYVGIYYLLINNVNSCQKKMNLHD